MLAGLGKTYQTSQDLPSDPLVVQALRRSQFPFPYRSVLHVLADETCHEAIRGDGSRRRYAEVLQGVRDYKLWLSDYERFVAFAEYVWGDATSTDYPVFDAADLRKDRLVLPLPELNVDLSSLSKIEEEATKSRRSRMGPQKKASRVLRDWALMKRAVTVHESRQALGR